MTRTDAAFLSTECGSPLNGAVLSVRDPLAGDPPARLVLLRTAGATTLIGAVSAAVAAVALIDVVLAGMMVIGAVSGEAAASVAGASAAGLASDGAVSRVADSGAVAGLVGTGAVGKGAACALRAGAVSCGAIGGVVNGAAGSARWRAKRMRRGLSMERDMVIASQRLRS